MSASQLEFVTGFYHSMDTENKELFVQKYYHPEATFVFGPMPPVHGIEEITKKYVEQVPTKHFNIKVVSESDDKFMVIADVIATAHSKELPSLTFAGEFVLDLASNKVKFYRVFIDISGLLVALGLDITADAEGKVTYKPRA